MGNVVLVLGGEGKEKGGEGREKEGDGTDFGDEASSVLFRSKLFNFLNNRTLLAIVYICI